MGIPYQQELVLPYAKYNRSTDCLSAFRFSYHLAMSTSNTNVESMATAKRNPKDSLKSTWRTWDRSKWNRHHWAAELFGLHPFDLNRSVPIHAKTDKMSYLPHWEGHKWILTHACWPILAQQLYTWYTGNTPGPISVFIFYTLAFNLNAIHELREMRHLAHEYGFLDGDKYSRDQIPDHAVSSVFRALSTTASFRPMMSVFLAYRRSQTPATVNWWYLPLETGLYAIILDFWFYWYHRCMHDFDSLWKYHRTHHLTKHPSSLLTLYADTEQEIFDIAIIPLLTWLSMKLMGFPMGFYEWWICHQYIVWTELWGHSGLRLYVTPPTTAAPFLKLMDAELTTEDHDLHHRVGWKKSHNYGKQTRLWDKIFGTCHERYESLATNIDWNSPAKLFTFGVF